MSTHWLVTGGTGFLGSALVRRLVQSGQRVRILDNNSRGALRRLVDVQSDVEIIDADIRDADAVHGACRGVDAVCHLAFVNGTELFYSQPDLVLEVGVSGMMNVINGCRAAGVRQMIVASSSEVYQTPSRIPTDETVALSIPDPLNPRYSYAGGKIISELLAINYGRRHFDRVVIFRPHNVYGKDMGWEHVVPQFVVRTRNIHPDLRGTCHLPIQGSGKETRSFVHVDDFTDGLMLLLQHGEHLGIYHVGTTEEITIEYVAQVIGECLGRRVEIVPGELQPGSTARRCPDVGRLTALGYRPHIGFREGVQDVVRWYDAHAHEQPQHGAA